DPVAGAPGLCPGLCAADSRTLRYRGLRMGLAPGTSEPERSPMRVLCHTAVFLLVLTLGALCPAGEKAGKTDWPALTQKPHARRAVPDLGLRPLLRTPDGKDITTKDEWLAARRRLHDAWAARLGKAPPRPEKLDARTEQTERLDGYTRKLVSFHSAGG